MFALRDYLGPELKDRTISDARHSVSLTEVLQYTRLAASQPELSNRSVMVSMSGQSLSALAMIDLDGVARRMLLCPPDLNPEHIDALIKDAEIDAIVTDQPQRWSGTDRDLIVGGHLAERLSSRRPNV